VWDVVHPQPPGGDKLERELCKHWHDDAEAQLKKLAPTDKESLSKWREVVGGGWQAILQRELPAAAEIDYERISEDDRGDFTQFVGLVKNKRHSEQLPALFFLPENWNKRVVLWLTDKGKAGLVDSDGKPIVEIRKLLKEGVAIAGVDLLFQGEFLQDEKVTQNRVVKNPREFAGYTYGYNHALIAQRAHDVLTMLAFAKNHPDKPQRIDLVALDGTAPIAALARALAGDAVHSAAINTNGFRFAAVDDYRSVNFLPGGAKYGDVPALLALGSTGSLWVGGEKAEALQLTATAYRAAGDEKKLTIAQDGKSVEAAIEFLLK
jgi:hypothetical protein